MSTQDKSNESQKDSQKNIDSTLEDLEKQFSSAASNEDSNSSGDKKPEDKNGKEKKVKPKKLTDKEKIAELEDQLLRKQAEFQNFQTRSAKELQEAKLFSTRMILFRLIPVLDEINRAKEHVSFEKDSPITVTFGKFEQALKDIGVEEYGVIGDEFDPKLHDAMQNIDKEGIDKVVIEAVVSKGYKFNENILRAAQVITASPR